MIKQIKTNLLKLSVIVLVLTITCFSMLFTTSASTVDFSESNTIKSSKLVSTRTLDGGVTYSIAETVAYNNGNVSENNTNDFTISWLDSQGSSAVMANWSSTSIVKWSGQKVTTLISDYEKKNPGYIVAGAINGDFFHIQTTCEVMNVCMQEGNLVKPVQWMSTGTGVIGWKADGTIVVGEPLNPEHSNPDPIISSNMYLEKLDANGEKVSEQIIASANHAISETGITLLTEDNTTKTFDLTGYKVVQVNYTMHRNALDRNENNDQLYVIGNVTNICDNLGANSTIPEYSVYIIAKDGSLDDIELGDTLRMQYHLEGEWADVVNCAGYHDQILKDGISLFYQSNPSDYATTCTDTAYINCAKNRTIVGSRPDGSTVYMTIEYNQNSTKSKLGASYYECAEYLRLLGCTNGWLLDGGGSATLAIKDGSSPKLVAGASDGSERNDGNALLMVVKDPGINLEITEKSHNKLVLHVVKNDNYGIHTLSNVKITLNNQTIDNVEVDGSYTFEGLEDETEYEVVISYNLNGSEEREQITRHITTSSYNAPTITCELSQVSDTACVIIPHFYYYSDNTNVRNAKLIINDQEYNQIVDNEPILITGLTANTEYQITYSLDSTDACNGKDYHTINSTMSENKFTTKDKYQPMIIKFNITKLTNDKCTFNYLYYDLNNSVKRAWIDYFGLTENIELNTEGEYTVEGIDPVQSEFIFTLNLEYDGGIVVSNEVSTKDITIEQEIIDEKPTKSGCNSKSAMIIYLSLMLGIVIYIVKKK